MDFSEFHFIGHLLLAILLGAVIGMERQWRQRIAGLRTNALVSGGSALFAILSLSLNAGGDQTRIPAQIVSGIGFLGAGVIMREGLSVRGLNTAATLWCSSAIGVLAGFGFSGKAFVGALAVLGTNILLRPLARMINRQPNVETEQEWRYLLRIVCRDEDETQVRYLLLQTVGASSTLVLRSLHSEDAKEARKIEVRAELESLQRCDAVIEQVVSRLSLERGVSAAAWTLQGALGGTLAGETLV